MGALFPSTTRLAQDCDAGQVFQTPLLKRLGRALEVVAGVVLNSKGTSGRNFTRVTSGIEIPAN